MGCLKLHILDKQYKRTELRVSYFNKKLTQSFCADNLRRWTLVSRIDPTGMIWTNSNGEAFTEDQLKKVQVYIFYDPVEFSDQTIKMYNTYVEQYGEGTVAISAVSTESSFIEDWGNMAGKIKTVDVNLHGNNQNLFIDTSTGEYITSTGMGKTNISGTSATDVNKLPTPKGNIDNAQLNINSCHSLDKSEKKESPLKGTKKQTVGEAFRENFNFKTVRGTEGAVNYNSSGEPTTQWYYLNSWIYLPKTEQKK